MAILISLLFHAALFITIALWPALKLEKPPLPEKPLQVVIVRPVPVTLKTLPKPKPKPPKTHYIDTTGLRKTIIAPKQPAFQSDRNSVAGSRTPGSGKKPLPEQQGKNRPNAQFTNQHSAIGKTPEKKAANGHPANSAAKMQHKKKVAKRQPTPLPKPTVQPTPQPHVAQAAPTPKLTPTPENALAMVRQQPTPHSLPKPTPVPDELPKPTPVPPKTQKSSRTASRRGYRPDLQKTRIKGGIAKQGLPGVNAIGTPMGRYEKQVSDAVGSRWIYYIKQRQDLTTTGTVKINFTILANGQVRDVRVISNTANGAVARYSIQAIRDANIPPIPKNLASQLRNGRLEIDSYSFSLY